MSYSTNLSIFVLLSLILLTTQNVAGQQPQQVVWLFMPNQNYPNQYQDQNRMSIPSNSENEINTGVGPGLGSATLKSNNFRPIYFLHQFHGQDQGHHHHGMPNSARFHYHPQIAPLFITDYGQGRNSPNSNSLFPQPSYVTQLAQRKVYNSGGESEAVYNGNNQIDKIFFPTAKPNYYGGGVTVVSRGTNLKEEVMDDDNNSNNDSSGGGSAEFDLGDFGNLRHGPKFTPLAFPSNVQAEERRTLPPSSSSTTKSVVITHSDHAHQRCILEGHQARLDPISGGCYTVGTKGPCGDFMIFTTIPNDNLNGLCDCDYESVDRPMALLGGKCHFLYTQAVCYPGYWLTSLAPNGEPICEANPCHVQSSPSFMINPNSKADSVVLYKGECISLNSPSMHCRRVGEVVLFPKGSTQPACGFPKSTKRIYRRQISNIGRFMCRPGMRRHRVTKKCVRTRAIVFH